MNYKSSENGSYHETYFEYDTRVKKDKNYMKHQFSDQTFERDSNYGVVNDGHGFYPQDNVSETIDCFDDQLAESTKVNKNSASRHEQRKTTKLNKIIFHDNLKSKDDCHNSDRSYESKNKATKNNRPKKKSITDDVRKKSTDDVDSKKFEDIKTDHERKRKISVPVKNTQDSSSNPLQENKLENVHVKKVYDRIAPDIDGIKHRTWPRVKMFIKSLEPGSLIADIGEYSLLYIYMLSLNCPS